MCAAVPIDRDNNPRTPTPYKTIAIVLPNIKDNKQSKSLMMIDRMTSSCSSMESYLVV